MRTAKSCGSGAAVLALSPGGRKLLPDDGGKRAVLRGEHEVSRKAIAQGRPECFALPCMLVCSFVCANRTRDRGCSKHPVFPAPSNLEEGNEDANLGRTCRENAEPYPRHCERSEAIHLSPSRDVGCVAALAMTWIGRSALDSLPVPVSSESPKP